MTDTLERTAPATGGHLERGLKNRHIQFLAIGGAIGTGLFLGSGIAIHAAGPSILLVYAIVGAALFVMVRAMGELLLSNLGYRSFQDFAEDYLGPWARYFVGWTYWLALVTVGAADAVGVQTYARLWWPDLPGWVPIVVTVGLVFGLNMIAVRAFGEAEFWFALIKVVTIVALIVVGGILIFTGFTAPDGTTASITHLWDHGGFFPMGFPGFIAGFQIAIFAFGGVEMIGTTAAEAHDPEKSLPKAINQVPVRIMLFYVLALAVVMCVTPWDEIDPAASPFVSLFLLTGFVAAAGVINFVVMTSAASAANSVLFATSRMAYGLATSGEAPAAFGRLNRRAVPAAALAATCVCVLIGGSLGLVFTNAFQLITTAAIILFIFVWAMILASYLVYRRRRPDLHASSKFPLRGGVWLSWTVLGFFAAMLVVLGLFDDTRIPLLCAPIWFAVLGIVYAVKVRRQRAAAAAADAALTR